MSSKHNSTDADSIMQTVVKNGSLIGELKDGPRYKQDLAAQLDISAKTVYRRARQLANLGILKKSNQGYRLTEVGHLYAELYKDVTNHVIEIQKLTCLGGESPPYEIIDGAKIIRPEQYAPDKPTQQIQLTLKRANSVKGFSPILLHPYFETEDDETCPMSLQGEIVFEKSALSVLQDEQWRETNSDLLQSLTVYEIEADFPYAILLVEDPEPEVLVVLCEPTGKVHGVIHNDTQSTVQWALDAFREHRSEATIVG